MPDLDRLFRRRDRDVEGVTSWLRSLDADELATCRNELAVVGTGLAEATLPLVDAIRIEGEVRELLRPPFEAANPGRDYDAWIDGLMAAARAQRQLYGGATDLLAILATAFAAARETDMNMKGDTDEADDD